MTIDKAEIDRVLAEFTPEERSLILRSYANVAMENPDVTLGMSAEAYRVAKRNGLTDPDLYKDRTP